MGVILRLLVIASGILMISFIMKTMKEGKMSAGQSLLWLMSGGIVIFFGIFPSIIPWIASLFDIYWPPAIVLAAGVGILFLICYNYAKEISVLRAQITELTEQVSVMKYELQEDELLKKSSRE